MCLRVRSVGAWTKEKMMEEACRDNYVIGVDKLVESLKVVVEELSIDVNAIRNSVIGVESPSESGSDKVEKPSVSGDSWFVRCRLKLHDIEELLKSTAATAQAVRQEFEPDTKTG